MSITGWEAKILNDIAEPSAEFAEMLHDAYNGNARVQHALGMWYETHGKREEAEKWYKKAADQDLEAADQHMHKSW